MPNKSIDSIGPKPSKNNLKPVAEHRAGEVVRPKGAPTQAGESIKPKGYQAPKKLESNIGVTSDEVRQIEKSKKRKKFKRNLGFAVLIGSFVALIISGVITYKALEDKKPAEGEYAVIEGRSIKQSEFEALRDAYIRYDQQKGQSDKRVSERRAADELMTRVGLEVQAEKYGIGVTQDDIDSYLAPAYLQYGSRDGLLRYNQHLYGWDEKPLYHKAKLDLLKQKLQSKIIAEMDLLGVYIRWDNHMDKSEEFQKEYGRKAVERLEKDYLPRLDGGQVAGDFIKTTDVNASLPVELNNERLNKTNDPIVRYLELKSAVNDPKNDPFEHEMKASDAKSAWAEIEKLEKVGDTTPVFKSDSGMYLALRIERKSEGEYISYESYLKKAIQEGKVNSSYNKLPIPDNGRNILPIPTSNADVSLLAKFLPKATASGSLDCWNQHTLEYEMRPADGSAGYAAITGKPFTMLVVRSGPDVCVPRDGIFGYFMNAQGRQAWTSPNVVHGMVIPLNCYGVVWDFAWSAPSGYQGFTASDYQAPNRILTGSVSTGLQWSPSEISGMWRDSTIYYGIANGAGRYAIAPVFFPDAPPPPPPPPYVTFMGYKVDENNNQSGAFSGAQVYLNESTQFTKDLDPGCTNPNPGAQPYCINNVAADANHVIRPQAVPGYEIVGYREGSNGLTPSAQYNYVANSQSGGATIHLWWVYRPVISQNTNVTCGVVSGSVSGPSGLSISTEVLIGGESIGPSQGTNFSFTVPDKFRDGISRPAVLRVAYSGSSRDFDVGTLSCNRNALCSSNNLGDVFPSNRVTIGVGGQEGGISIAMSNNGESIWSTYSTGTYQLVLTPEADNYWDIVAGPSVSVPVGEKIYPQPNPISGKTFAPITVTLTANPSDGTTPLGFQMAFIPSGGGAVQRFGAACSTELRILSSYGPWLRTQNGNVSAMGVIKGQEALSLTDGNLGGRRAAGSAGTTADGHKDDINLEATYLLLAKAVGNGPFCSTNAYILGRDDNVGVMSDLDSCDFKQYNFALRANLERALSANVPTEELIYREANQAYYDAPTSCPLTGPAPSGSARYVNGGIYDGSGALPGISGNNCPTIRVLNGLRDGYRTLGANPSSPVTIRQVTSRGTVLVDGDLYINANIINAPSAPSFNRDDLNALNQLPNLGIIVKGDILIDKDVTKIDASLYASGKIKTCENLYNPSSSTENDPNTSNGFKLEVLSGSTVVENTQATRCSNQLKIHGVMASKGGFMLGRNFVDFSAMAGRVGRPQFSAEFEYDARRGLYYGRPAEDVVFNGLMLILPPPGFEHLSNPDFFQARYTSESAQPRF